MKLRLRTRRGAELELELADPQARKYETIQEYRVEILQACREIVEVLDPAFDEEEPESDDE